MAALSAPRSAQRPCSTQNAESGIAPDFGFRIKLDVMTRSCLPPLTMSPDWMKTGSSPRFSILSSLTSPVSKDADAPVASRFLEGQWDFSRAAFAVNEIDGQVFVNVRTGNVNVAL